MAPWRADIPWQELSATSRLPGIVDEPVLVICHGKVTVGMYQSKKRGSGGIGWRVSISPGRPWEWWIRQHPSHWAPMPEGPGK